MSAKLGFPGLEDDVTAPLVDELTQPSSTGAMSTTRRSSAPWRAARGHPEPARSPFLDLVAFDAWVERWRAWARMPTRWTGSIPCTFPATTWSRKPWPQPRAATSTRSPCFWTQSLAPFDERPGLERYAVGAPDDFGTYRTFCGT